MAETAIGPSHAATRSRGTHWPRRPPVWLWGVSGLAQVGVVLLLTRFTFFYADDWLFMREAQTTPLSLSYLRENLFGHFSPISRFLDKLLVVLAPGQYALAHGIALATYAVLIIAFALVVRWILGNGWAAFTLTLVFGQSVFLVRLLTWWTATANLMPASAGMLLALAGYLRWTERRSAGWLLVSWAGLFIALIDYETAMLLPIYLLLIRLVVMQDSFDPREWLRIVWRERLIWVGLIGLDVLQLANYYFNYYVKTPSPTIGQDLHFLVASAFQGFVPALFGYKRYPQLPPTSVVVWSVALLALGVIVILLRRPRAWRCGLVAIVCFALGMLPLAFNRLAADGVDVGTELYYEQSVQFVCLILFAFAISRRWGGTRAVATSPRWWRRAVGDAGSRSLGVVGTALVALAGYGVLYLVSAHQIGTAGATPEPHQSKPYIGNLRRSAAAYVRRSGRQPNLLNLTVPFGIVSSAFIPYNQYDQIFPLVRPHLLYNQWRSPLFSVSDAGNLTRTRLSVIDEARLNRATVSRASAGGAVTGVGSREAVCVKGSGVQWIHVPFARPPRPQSGTILAEEIGVRFRMPRAASVTVEADDAAGQQPADFDPHVWRAGNGSLLLDLTTMPEPNQVDFAVPAGACLTRVAILAIRPGG